MPKELIEVFLNPNGPEVFHSVVHLSSVFDLDHMDVESIHEEARITFQGLLDKAASPERANQGRALLLLGESGSGKTHLMRAFRSAAHQGRRGFFTYTQMSTGIENYHSYLLNNIVASLDWPYREPEYPRSGLYYLSDGLAFLILKTGIKRDPARKKELKDKLDALRTGDNDDQATNDLVHSLCREADYCPGLDGISRDIVRAFLMLQTKDTGRYKTVCRYLRCQPINPHDLRLVADIQVNDADGAQQDMIKDIGKLAWAAHQAPFIVCIDQLEDIFSNDEAAGQRFRNAVSAARSVADGVPSSVVVVACLQDYWETLSRHLTQSSFDRLVQNPEPVKLESKRNEEEVKLLVAKRLESYYRDLNREPDPDDPCGPFPPEFISSLANKRTRDVLETCRLYRDDCLKAGELVACEPRDDCVPDAPPPSLDMQNLEQAWNDHKSAWTEAVSEDQDLLHQQLAWAIETCNLEWGDENLFSAQKQDDLLLVSAGGRSHLAGICNKTPKGGALTRQLQAMAQHPHDAPRALIRFGEFPSSPNAKYAPLIADVITSGGLKISLADSEWRTLAALQGFLRQNRENPQLTAWLGRAKPLGELPFLRKLLDLEQIAADLSENTAPPPRESTTTSRPQNEAGPAAQPAGRDHVLMGRKRSAAKEPVLLDPEVFTRHAAFLGGTGSGKTTVALQVVESLLLRGVPCVLVDRKGDLCGYADPDRWQEPLPEPERQAAKDALRQKSKVSLFTPGDSRGNPLFIPLVPLDADQVDERERERLATYSSSSVASMLGYRETGQGSHLRAMLKVAMQLLWDRMDGSRHMGLEDLLELINRQDYELLDALGQMDRKLFKKLAQDLSALSINKKPLLEPAGVPLDLDRLLGPGAREPSGAARLSVISCKFLGGQNHIEFWLAQFFTDLCRWVSRSPSGRLQGVLLLDEADIYLPAQSKPATKEPLEDLLRRARSAGLGIFLVSQSPGDIDYKCRDQINTWLLGKITQKTSIDKLRPLWSQGVDDPAAQIPGQGIGEFVLVGPGRTDYLKTQRCLLETRQVPEEDILHLAKKTRES